jgi:hypothetical protein
MRGHQRLSPNRASTPPPAGIWICSGSPCPPWKGPRCGADPRRSVGWVRHSARPCQCIARRGQTPCRWPCPRYKGWRSSSPPEPFPRAPSPLEGEVAWHGEGGNQGARAGGTGVENGQVVNRCSGRQFFRRDCPVGQFYPGDRSVGEFRFSDAAIGVVQYRRFAVGKSSRFLPLSRGS